MSKNAATEDPMAVPNLVSLSVGILTPFMKCISVSPFAY